MCHNILGLWHITWEPTFRRKKKSKCLAFFKFYYWGKDRNGTLFLHGFYGDALLN
jgi:hypothetical protein